MTEQYSPSKRQKSDSLQLGFMLRTAECFGKQVSGVVFGRAVGDFDILRFDTFANEVVTNVDVFGSGVELIVVSESNGGLVVGLDVSG